MSDLLLIKTVKDIIENANLIIKHAEISPIFDPIFKIVLKENQDADIILKGPGVSDDFLRLLKLEQQKVVGGCGKYLKLPEYFESDDVILFFLKNVNIKNTTFNIKSIIHTKQSIDSLVLDTILPCNRIAMNSEKDIFYVSLQCLYSLLTGNCFIPKYLQTMDDFILAFNKNIHPYKIVYNDINHHIKNCAKNGYTFSYIETKTLLPCILSRIQG